MPNNNSPVQSKAATVKFIIFTVVIGAFIAVGLSNNNVNVALDKEAIVAVEELQSTRSKNSRETLIESLDEGRNKLGDSNRIMSNVGADGKPLTLTQGAIETKPVMCPQYLLPAMPELPTLPAKEVLSTVTRDQLNFILYQNIKSHQERTIEVRRRINDSYSEYLLTCN